LVTLPLHWECGCPHPLPSDSLEILKKSQRDENIIGSVQRHCDRYQRNLSPGRSTIFI